MIKPIYKYYEYISKKKYKKYESDDKIEEFYKICQTMINQ